MNERGSCGLRYCLVLGLLVFLGGCANERHFAGDAIWPFGNPNGPVAASETAQRALGHTTDVTPIAPQAGDVWPGPVQPVPTLSDEQREMTQPLGAAYTPSLPSPYPPGVNPPANADLGESNLQAAPGTNGLMAPGSPGLNGTSGGMQPGLAPPVMPPPGAVSGPSQ
jgi:hypothetical protein